MSELNKILPKCARPKPFSDRGEVYACSIGWVVSFERKGVTRTEILVDCSGLDEILFKHGFDKYGNPLEGDGGQTSEVDKKEESEQKEDQTLESEKQTSETEEEQSPADDQTSETEEVPEEKEEEVQTSETEDLVLSREILTNMPFAELKKLATENEVTEKSREKIVDELCALYGLE